MMKKLAMALGICALMACGAASAANGQVVSKAKSACQNNATQCAQQNPRRKRMRKKKQKQPKTPVLKTRQHATTQKLRPKTQ